MMRLTYVVLEGTPQELDESQVAREIAALSGQHGDPRATGATSAMSAETEPRSPVPGVPDEGQDTVSRLLERNPAGQHFRMFLDEASSLPSVRVFGKRHRRSAAGAPLDYSDYLRLRKIGSPVGGFAYVWPETGAVLLRLGHLEPDLRARAPHAVETSAGHRAYRVRLTITDGATLAEALVLARRAYEAT